MSNYLGRRSCLYPVRVCTCYLTILHVHWPASILFAIYYACAASLHFALMVYFCSYTVVRRLAAQSCWSLYRHMHAHPLVRCEFPSSSQAMVCRLPGRLHRLFSILCDDPSHYCCTYCVCTVAHVCSLSCFQARTTHSVHNLFRLVVCLSIFLTFFPTIH